MALSKTERAAFLAEPHVATLGVDAGSDRGPLVVPVWYFYESDGPLWVLMPPDSRKARLISEAGRFSLLAQRVLPTKRYVSVEGDVLDTRPATEDEVRRMGRRYLSPDAVERYVEFARHEQRVEMQPRHWISADLG